ncbi:MAG: hypothetical protein JXA89_07805, partial [Anaerolineae bacterium]|nr:hypothetical protein [Anaerolineae bacterium]
MNLDLVLRIVSLVLSLIGFILTLYVLALNFRSPANRHLGMLFLIFALNNLFIGLILAPSVTTVEDARSLTYG